MRDELTLSVIGVLCLTIIIVVALYLGYDGALAGAGASAIVAILTWQSKKALDRRGTNTEALKASLKRAGFKNDKIKVIVANVKKRRVKDESV